MAAEMIFEKRPFCNFLQLTLHTILKKNIFLAKKLKNKNNKVKFTYLKSNLEKKIYKFYLEIKRKKFPKFSTFS